MPFAKNISDFKRAQVTQAYKTCYEDAICLKAMDAVTVVRQDDEWPEFFWCINSQNKEGWVPQSYFFKEGEIAHMLKDYSAKELTVSQGEELVLIDSLGGWFWAENKNGEQGWLPEKCVSLKS